METLCPSVQSSGEAVRDELTLGGILRAFLPLLLHLLKLARPRGFEGYVNRKSFKINPSA